MDFYVQETNEERNLLEDRISQIDEKLMRYLYSLDNDNRQQSATLEVMNLQTYQLFNVIKV